MSEKFLNNFLKVLHFCMRNRHFRYGLPFFSFLGFGFLGLREFNTVRYDFRHTQPMDIEEVRKMGIRVKDKSETLEETYEKMKNWEIDNWENIRGPRYLLDNEEGKISFEAQRRVMELTCAVQNYHWGKKGERSLVAKFAAANSEIVIDSDIPYAELWMGAHPNGPSLIKATRTQLSQHISLNPDELGSETAKAFGNQLPFLMKILSVETPLSIQVHPDKSQAEELFRKFPEVYKDSNHKPEMVVALTKCELLCSFQNVSSIKYFLEHIPEFKKLIDSKKLEKFVKSSSKFSDSIDSMKECFEDVVNSEKKVVACAIEELLERSKSLTSELKEHFLIPLVEKLKSSFPNDVGVLLVYFLRYLVLEPGEVIYVAPREPHAYISGDYMECMANSDNVVRAALTPKLRDVPTLMKILSFKCCEDIHVPWEDFTSEAKFFRVASPPHKDFAIGKYEIPKNEGLFLSKRKSASILCVLKGKGKMGPSELAFGKVFFVPAESEYQIECEEDLLLFQAFCNENKMVERNGS